MTDEEHLAKAGIADAPASEPASSTAPSTPESSAAPSGEASASNAAPTAKTETQKAIEMFELMGNKYPVNTEFQINHGGKVLKVPYSTLANNYRQTTHFEDKFKAFNEEKKSWDQKKTEYEQAIAFKQKYGLLQDWSEKNPQDWQVLWDLFQNRDKNLLTARTGLAGNQTAFPGQVGAQTPNGGVLPQHLQPLVEELTKVKAQLGNYEKAYSEWEQGKKTAQETQDTNFVKQEINDFQKEYPEINLTERDPEGVALWAKIIQWGLQRGYTEFAPAAMMYLKPRVTDTIAARARSEALKGFKTDSANGIVRRMATPSNGGQGQIQPPKDVKKMSYAQLAEHAKQQLASGGN